MQGHRSQPEAPALGAKGFDQPALCAFAAQRADDPAGSVPRQSGVVIQFQPQLGPEAVIGHLELFLCILANLATACTREPAHGHPAHAVPRQDKANRQYAREQLGQAKRKITARVEGDEPGGDDAKDKEDEARIHALDR